MRSGSGHPPCSGSSGSVRAARRGILELCSTGVDSPAPGGCLNCGARLGADGEAGSCPDCGVRPAELIARARDRCGDPPELARIRELANLGLFRLAFNAIDLRLAHQPHEPASLIAKAQLMTAVQRPARAIPLLHRAVELGVAPRQIAIELGVALANSGRPAEAVEVYEALLAIEVDPARRAIALTNLGGCLSALGQCDAARLHHRLAIDADPERLGPRWNLFANLVRGEAFDEALALIDETLALACLSRSELDNLQAYRAEILIALGRYPDALQAIDASLAHEPHELERLSARARILIYLDRRDAARACITQMFCIDCNSQLARILLERLDRTHPTTKN